MSEQEQDLNSLRGKQKKYLRGLGHHLAISVIVGREGLTVNLIDSCNDSLRAHELIKVKLGQNCPLEKKEAALQLARQTGSEMVQLLGKTVLLYRENPDISKDERIRLPK